MKGRAIMNFPKDPVMLLSVVNTALRDHYTTLYALIDDTGIDEEELKAKLASIDYHYDSVKNQFK
ncbi:protein of unknown function [Pseudobutyrivibrio sp. 49]|nr:protein of unknown function [Pseudobutyrivibrio sp. 49]SFN88455.1 protein of unknown function [Pseudobutyrivibrio sp. UC1225]